MFVYTIGVIVIVLINTLNINVSPKREIKFVNQNFLCTYDSNVFHTGTPVNFKSICISPLFSQIVQDTCLKTTFLDSEDVKTSRNH